MTNQEFTDVFDRRMELARKVLVKKGEEYASNTDRLHNFKQAGAMLGESPEQALWGMNAKHIISMQDMIKAPDTVTEAQADEKIGDAINYLILLEALLKERRQSV